MEPFISYAQNLEDVLLWRALKDVGHGFYIDVGANDPEVDSVTKAFYERGWNGINIEPIPMWHEKLLEQRPRDINLQIAAGSESGEIIMFDFIGTGLSTADQSIAEKHQREGGYEKKETRVNVESLDWICRQYHVETIHFLKIDVEGTELDVIRGINFERMRPWIILVESTLPNSQIENYSDWEPILLGAGYEFVYFDGLNRYYLAKEHLEIKCYFNAPPNVFDRYIRNDHFAAINSIREMEARVVELTETSEFGQALEKISYIKDQNKNLCGELEIISSQCKKAQQHYDQADLLAKQYSTQLIQEKKVTKDLESRILDSEKESKAKISQLEELVLKISSQSRRRGSSSTFIRNEGEELISPQQLYSENLLIKWIMVSAKAFARASLGLASLFCKHVTPLQSVVNNTRSKQRIIDIIIKVYYEPEMLNRIRIVILNPLKNKCQVETNKGELKMPPLEPLSQHTQEIYNLLKKELDPKSSL